MCAAQGFVGRFTKQAIILFSETTEVPEAELESDVGHGGRIRILLLQSAADAV
jgi:hypothetical protein